MFCFAEVATLPLWKLFDLKEFRSSHQRGSVNKAVLKIFRNSQKVTVSEACNFIKKETPIQVFSCEFCEILKKTFFIVHLRQLFLNTGKLLTTSLIVPSMNIPDTFLKDFPEFLWECLSSVYVMGRDLLAKNPREL